MRDDFPRHVVETLAKLVGNRCSNPACRKRTSGPHTDDDKALTRLRTTNSGSTSTSFRR